MKDLATGNNSKQQSVNVDTVLLRRSLRCPTQVIYVVSPKSACRIHVSWWCHCDDVKWRHTMDGVTCRHPVRGLRGVQTGNEQKCN